MRLSIECSGCKATLTSDPNPFPVTAKKDKAKIKKERRVTEIDRNKSGNKKKQSLSDCFELSSPSSVSKCSDEEEINATHSLSSSFSSESTSSSKYHNKIKNKQKKGVSGVAHAAAAVKVERGVAVVENSSDPYGDFRRSMVEMMMARRKLSDGDLNRLLRCYLSLNPPQHHPVILKAFYDLFMGSSVQQMIS